MEPALNAQSQIVKLVVHKMSVKPAIKDSLSQATAAFNVWWLTVNFAALRTPARRALQGILL